MAASLPNPAALAVAVLRAIWGYVKGKAALNLEEMKELYFSRDRLAAALGRTWGTRASPEPSLTQGGHL